MLVTLHLWGSGYSWGGDIDGDNNSLSIKQLCNQTPCGGDRFEFHITGSIMMLTLLKVIM